MIEHNAMEFDQKLQRWAGSQSIVFDLKENSSLDKILRQSDYRSNNTCSPILQSLCQSDKKIQAQGRKEAPKSAEIRIDLQKIGETELQQKSA